MAIGKVMYEDEIGATCAEPFAAVILWNIEFGHWVFDSNRMSLAQFIDDKVIIHDWFKMPFREGGVS